MKLDYTPSKPHLTRFVLSQGNVMWICASPRAVGMATSISEAYGIWKTRLEGTVSLKDTT